MTSKLLLCACALTLIAVVVSEVTPTNDRVRLLHFMTRTATNDVECFRQAKEEPESLDLRLGANADELVNQAKMLKDMFDEGKISVMYRVCFCHFKEDPTSRIGISADKCQLIESL